MIFSLFALYAVLSVSSLMLIKAANFGTNETNWAYLIGGGGLYGFSFMTWILIVSKTVPSIAYPIAVSLTLMGTISAEMLFYGTSLNLMKTAGLILITAGVWALAVSQ